MSDDRQLLIGIDMTDDFTQICCYQNQNQNAATNEISIDSSNPLIPTSLLVKESNKEWVYGEEAVRLNGLYGGMYFDHLLTRLILNENVVVYGTEMTPQELITKFFKNLLGYVRQHYLNNTIAKMVITIAPSTPLLMDKIYECLKPLGLERDRVVVLSRVECFMYYVLSQRQDLWTNEVGLFHFDEQGLLFYRLVVNRHTIPASVIVNKIDLSEELKLTEVEHEDTQRVTAKFENLTNQLLFKRVTTSLFFTGKGFAPDWCDQTLKKLCVGRRVFKGQNLYVKGACYAAKALKNEELKNYVFLSDDMITTSISLNVYRNAKEESITLAKAGTLWWQVDSTIQVILEDTNELEFTVSSLLKREPVKEVYRIDGLMNRERKTIRLMLQVQFIDRDTAILTVRDTGFGQIYETTYRVWEEQLT